MQRTSLILACFVICANCFPQQYPFVHYTPKDGLISNQIKSIYQDSKGRLYFTSVNGLSVYEGSRFINYTSKNGLNLDIVNCVMEMGEDSIWIVTNTNKINCIVKGKIKTLSIKGLDIIINGLIRNKKGDLYAAAEEGLYIFEKDHFTKIPITDTSGNDINKYVTYLLPFGDYLILQRDNTLLPDPQSPLFLYNTITKKVTAELSMIFNTHEAPDGRVWVTTDKKIMALDTTELGKGKIVLEELPGKYASLRNLGRYFILFDSGNNAWLGNQSNILIKAEPDGTVNYFPNASGLRMHYINSIFLDREGITWIATNNAGLSKLVHNNFSFFEKPFNISPPVSDIIYNEARNLMLFYFKQNRNVVLVKDNTQYHYKLNDAPEIHAFTETPGGLFGIASKSIYKMVIKDSVFYAKKIFTDTSDHFFSHALADNNGNLIVCGKNYVGAIINEKITCKKILNYYADYPAMDSKGNIWVTTRATELIMYSTRPGDPSHYLEQKFYFNKELCGISPRSIVIDKNDNIWIGTRSHGIQVFRFTNGDLVRLYDLSTASGLSDDFTTHLACDANNDIWACSPRGLDKIIIKNGKPVIENLTKQNSIYQTVYKIAIDKNNVAWGTVSNGLIRISPERERIPGYSPTLIVSMVKAGKDTISEDNKAFLSHKQNSLNFYFTATSFLDEKQVMYSYRLHKGNTTLWSEPSNNAAVSFINLPPGEYTLDIKASFPAGRYPEQVINYKFFIAPPWWNTWWFRSVTGLFVAALLIFGLRFYYRRKLEKQMAVLEKQQAIEKERTRIATDMHDDLGAGLSRIKFLSETIGIKRQQQEPIEEDVNKIRQYSHEMIDKMGEIVWALNEKNDSLSDLLSYTRSYAMEYLSQNGIKCKAEMPANFSSLFVSGDFRRNVFLTIKEALHNIVKHSQATEVELRISVNQNLSINLKDNGRGFDKNNTRLFSNGLTNMESRVKEIGGQIEILNNGGTVVNMVIPLVT